MDVGEIIKIIIESKPDGRIIGILNIRWKDGWGVTG